MCNCGPCGSGFAVIGGLPSGDKNGTLGSALTMASLSGVSFKSPTPGWRGPSGKAEPHSGCHLLSGGKRTCPNGLWGQGPAVRGLAWWMSAPLAAGLSWAAVSGKGVPAAPSSPCYSTPALFPTGHRQEGPGDIKGQWLPQATHPQPWHPAQGHIPLQKAMRVPQGLAPVALGPGAPGKHTWAARDRKWF